MIASDGRARYLKPLFTMRSRLALSSRSEKTKCTHPDPAQLGRPINGKRRFQRINQSISRAPADGSAHDD